MLGGGSLELALGITQVGSPSLGLLGLGPKGPNPTGPEPRQTHGDHVPLGVSQGVELSLGGQSVD